MSITAPPQHNATVVRVRGAGTADDWDRPAGPGAIKWQGEARAYYREDTTRLTAAGATNIVTKRELIVTMDTLDELQLDSDDLITFTPDGAEETTATPQSIPRVRLAGLPRALQTSKIRLTDA